MPLNQPRWRECPERSSRAPPDGQEAINPMQKNGENDLHHINIIRGDLTLKNGPILVPVKEVESLLELLNLLISELVETRCHICNWEKIFEKLN